MLTTEEARVPIYLGEGQPTVAGEVTKATPLEQLNLNWTEKQLPQRSRTKHVHGLHPYLGKYVPQLVEIFLRKYFEPGDMIIDPFVGSGTTLVQANELGIHSVGFDISAFNALLCKVKTNHYDIRQAELEAKDILEKARNAKQPQNNGQLSLWQQPLNRIEIPQIDNAYLQEWYAPQALNELLTYRQLIEQGGYLYNDLLQVILTRSARSARLTTHFDLDFPKNPQREPYWCYKHSRTCYPTEEAFKFLVRYTADTIHRIKAFMQVRTSAQITVCHADSRVVDICETDGIITSPPYVGLIDYHDQHSYAYHLLNLNDNSHREIGPASSGSSEKARLQYQKDIAQVFRNVSQNMASGSPIIVVAGDRYDLYPGIAQMSGLEEEVILKRHVNRRTGRRSSEFYESIFIWRKP